jgi:protein subunit release factor B
MNFPVELSEKTLQKAKDLKVFPGDIEEKFIRGSGAGGQKVNKTNSCVWLRHAPTGFEVKTQEHRERAANRKRAYRLLIDKIEDKKRGKASERMKKIFKLMKQKKRRTRKSKEKMLEAKRRRGDIKASRKNVKNVRD